MMTVKYATKDGISIYKGEIESTTDYLVTVKVTEKNGEVLPLIKGKPQYRSFSRDQIVEMRNALGQHISKEASL